MQIASFSYVFWCFLGANHATEWLHESEESPERDIQVTFLMGRHERRFCEREIKIDPAWLPAQVAA